jgi:hypothetical protein
MSRRHIETRADKSIVVCALHCPLFYETARKDKKCLCIRKTKALGECYSTQSTYLIIEPEFFLILLVVTLDVHIFTITRAQPIALPSPLPFDAFRMRLLRSMCAAALPQSIAEKNIAGIIILHVTTHRRGEKANAKIRFIGHRRMFRTRVVVRARDATRRGCRDRLILRETTRLVFHCG